MLAEHDTLTTTADQKLQKSVHENELLKKQLGDLGRQLPTLLKELGQHQDLSLPSNKGLEHDEMSQPAENIEAVITNNLVLFCSILQLQEQNQKLLKIICKLGSKLGSKEKEYKEALECGQGEPVCKVHEVIKQLQVQLETSKQSSKVTIQVYMKECDTLLGLLQQQQESSSSVRMLNGISGQSQTAELSELAKELEGVQKQFDVYHTKMGVNITRLRNKTLTMQHEAHWWLHQGSERPDKFERSHELKVGLSSVLVLCILLTFIFSHLWKNVDQIQNDYNA